MKFLAILRDSLRETLDIKILYVMVALSLLTVVLVGSISYRQVSVEKYLKAAVALSNIAVKNDPKTNRFDLHLSIENFQRLDTQEEPWLGDYEFDYVISFTLPPGEDAKKDFGVGRKMMFATMRKQLEDQLGHLFRKVDVEESAVKDLPAGSDAVGFHIRTQDGTTIKGRQEWFHEPVLFFGLLPLPVPYFSKAGIVEFIGDTVIGLFGSAVTLAISLIITAFFLPNMLTRGTIDLLLVKPIHRTSLFVYKYVGGLLFMFLNTAVIMVGLWLVIGWRTEVWLNSLLVCIFVFTFQFAVIYSVSALTAVLTRSSIVCILVSFATWLVLFGMGWAHWGFIESKRAVATDETKSHWAYISFDLLYAITPRFKEMDWLTSKMIKTDLAEIRPEPAPPAGDRAAQEEYEKKQKRAREIHDKQIQEINRRFGSYNWTTCLTVSGAFIVVMLGLACWRFSVADY
jgi:ABC-type transport system involved in multi-copper enzyme maturation permease subunit